MQNIPLEAKESVCGLPCQWGCKPYFKGKVDRHKASDKPIMNVGMFSH